MKPIKDGWPGFASRRIIAEQKTDQARVAEESLRDQKALYGDPTANALAAEKIRMRMIEVQEFAKEVAAIMHRQSLGPPQFRMTAEQITERILAERQNTAEALAFTKELQDYIGQELLRLRLPKAEPVPVEVVVETKKEASFSLGALRDREKGRKS